MSRMTLIAAMLFVNPGFPPTSVGGLIQYAKANPGKVNFASAGNGTTSHLAGELFRTMAGIDIVHVPYRGGALAAADVIGGAGADDDRRDAQRLSRWCRAAGSAASP